MVREEVGEYHYVTWVECFRDALIFGRNNATVFKSLHEGVDVVDLIDLGARKVDDYSLLVVVRVGDIGDFAISYYKGPIGRGEIVGVMYL